MFLMSVVGWYLCPSAFICGWFDLFDWDFQPLMDADEI